LRLAQTTDLPSQEAIDAIFQLALGEEAPPAFHPQAMGFPPPMFPHPPPPGFAPPPMAPMAPPGYGRGMPYGYPPLPPHFAPMPRPPPFFAPPPHQQPLLSSSATTVRIPDFARMSGREIAQIVRAQLSAVRTGDEYVDDFYASQLAARRARAPAPARTIPGLDMSNDARPAATLELLKALHRGEALPRGAVRAPRPMSSLPLAPSAAGGGAAAPSRAQHSKAWAETNQVLGKTVKSSIRTPRELIEMQDVGTAAGFASSTWQLRAAALEAHTLLDRIADNDALLEARVASLNGPLPVEATEAMRPLEAEQLSLLARLEDVLGLRKAEDETLMGLLWLNRGRRAVCRAVPCLLPAGLQALLNAAARLLVFFVCTAPDGRNSSDAAQQERAALDASTAALLSHEFARCALPQLTHAMELLAASQSPESLRMVLSTPGGAEVVRSIVARGQELADRADAGAKEWNAALAAFMAMAEEGIAAKEL